MNSLLYNGYSQKNVLLCLTGTVVKKSGINKRLYEKVIQKHKKITSNTEMKFCLGIHRKKSSNTRNNIGRNKREKNDLYSRSITRTTRK